MVESSMQVTPRVQEVLDRLEETRGLYYNLARPSVELLFLLARLVRPREIVEVGTSNGYSAIALGAAVQPFRGRVITIERSGRLVEEARKNIADAGLQDVVTVFPGSAYKALKRLPGPFRFVFLDATRQEYVGYLEQVRSKLAPRALLVADNLLSHQDELAEFTRAVSKDSHFSSIVIPVGMGLLLSAYEEQTEPSPDRKILSLGELVASARSRVFRGTASQVRNGEMFTRASMERS
jgi:predicted O-methyltransferase YrrM